MRTRRASKLNRSVSPAKSTVKKTTTDADAAKARAASPPLSSSSSSSSSSSLSSSSAAGTGIKRGEAIYDTPVDVLLFKPNIVGYIRLLCMLLSFYYAVRSLPSQTNYEAISWKFALIYYLMAFTGDVVDGYVARAFNECSIYGGVLDMVTDRVSTCGFIMILSHLYTEYVLYGVLLVVLDIASHWFHVMSVSGLHHKAKATLQNRNIFLQWYYGIYPLFGYCCVGTELFYVFLYIYAHYNDSILIKQYIYQICWYMLFPACVLKQIVNVVQLWSAAYTIAANDAIVRQAWQEINGTH